MWTRQRRVSHRDRLILPVIGTAFLAYFGYQAWHGTYGLQSKTFYETRIDELAAELDTLKKQRAELERKVALLSDGSLERDMVDEQARRALNLVDPKEIVVLFPREQSN